MRFRLLLILVALFIVANIPIDKLKALPFMVIPVFAHCDTMRGPVIKAAKKALNTENVTWYSVGTKER